MSFHSRIRMSLGQRISTGTLKKTRMKKLSVALLLWALPVIGQSFSGELRLTVTDPTGLGLKSTVELVSQVNEFRQTLTTDDQGNLDAKRLPYGIYDVRIQAQ